MTNDFNRKAEDLGRKAEDFGRKVEEKFNQAKPRVEEEVQKIIAYLNDEVVPDVRVNSTKALRAAAEKLSQLAERFERRTGGR
jgi:hypothetical protein